MSSKPLNHRNVFITLNMRPTLEALSEHFIRLIDEAKPMFLNGGPLAKKIQKRWYGKQLEVDGYTYGYIYFTVTNRSIMKRDFDLDDPAVHVDDLEFTFHVKQNETIILANNFTSGSVRYKSKWGEFNINRVELNLYGGTDVESALLFRDAVAKVESQLAAFKLDNTTLITQNELELLPVRTYDQEVL